MSTATLTLTDFLLARIAEDEADAQGAIEMMGRLPSQALSAELSTLVKPRATIMGMPTIDPRRWKAECEAKRRIIDEAYNNAADIDGEWGDGHTAAQIRAGECDYYGPKAANRFLAPLASIYAEHPDYDPGWT